MKMEPVDVVKKWVWCGVEDLYFAFCIEYNPHRSYALFAEIMGLEKILKSYLLFKNGNKYSSLSMAEAQEIIECLVKKWGHSIERMLKETSQLLDNDTIKIIKDKNYDGYTGRDLVKAIEAGYMESRYPVARPIYKQFKMKGVDLYYDPLESSGITKFIYEICRTILIQLKTEIDLAPIGSDFIKVYGSRESTQRFINLIFNADIKKYL